MSEKENMHGWIKGNGLDEDLLKTLEDIGYKEGEATLEPHSGEIRTRNNTRQAEARESQKYFDMPTVESARNLIDDLSIITTYLKNIKLKETNKEYISPEEKKSADTMETRRMEIVALFFNLRSKMLKDPQFKEIYQRFEKVKKL